jgi:cytochrome c biogenesis protein CcmG/thiol:disulfide interchange protein DsbE
MTIRAATSRLALALSLAAATVLAACGGGSEPAADPGAGNPESRATDYARALADAPPPLAKLYANGDEIVDGGLPAYEAQLAELRGFPVVVNAWASWCGPCRLEFPDFQEVSAERGDDIAFLGVDVDDAPAAAEDFLAELPLPYPSISDPDAEVRDALGLRGLPGTAFYDSQGELVYLKQGPYLSADELEADIDKYVQ